MSTYDYVVIGAGSAGCAVAARLAASGEYEVAVVEAGPPDDLPEIAVPAAFPSLFKGSVDWNYTTEPQKNLNARSDYWPRGKVYGGSSSLNAQIYQRGAHADYDGWAALGNDGWSFADMLPLFKRAQHQERGESEYHGVGGPINVTDLRDPNPLSRAFVAAAVEQGHPANDDFNAATQAGFGLYQVTQKEGTRWSAARGYLHPALDLPNFTVIAPAMVTRLTFDGARCTGCVYDGAVGEQQITARREVVVSGGAVNSPQLLMLSGVGPREQLESLGIPVRRDLPGVGENLQDHLAVPVAYTCTAPITLTGARDPEQGARFLDAKMGLLTSNIGESGGFLTVGESAAPDLQFHFVPGWFVDHGFRNPASGHGFTALPGLVGTRSVGRMWLRSADPQDKPALDPNYLGDDRDMQVLVDGIRIVRDIIASPAFDGYRGAEHLPGDAVRSDDDLREFVRNYVQGLYHPVGTCAMGVDERAVVDPQLRVRGLEGLRVADASIMPVIVNANTNNPSIVIGEKCAEMILNAGG